MQQRNAASAPPGTNCQPWCTRHDADSGLCYGADEQSPGSLYNSPERIGISYAPDTGTLIAVGDMHMQVPEAMGFVAAVMRQIGRAMPPSPAVAA